MANDLFSDVRPELGSRLPKSLGGKDNLQSEIVFDDRNFTKFLNNWGNGKKVAKAAMMAAARVLKKQTILNLRKAMKGDSGSSAGNRKRGWNKSKKKGYYLNSEELVQMKWHNNIQTAVVNVVRAPIQWLETGTEERYTKGKSHSVRPELWNYIKKRGWFGTKFLSSSDSLKPLEVRGRKGIMRESRKKYKVTEKKGYRGKVTATHFFTQAKRMSETAQMQAAEKAAEKLLKVYWLASGG